MGFLQAIDHAEFNPRLLGDNKGALALAKDNAYRPRTKHIYARERFITQMVQSGQCLLEYIPTRDMVTDTMTKALPKELYKKHAHAMGVIYAASSTRMTCNKCHLNFPTRNKLHEHIKQLGHFADELLPTALKCVEDGIEI